jgi:hypothetical protein
VFKIDVRVQDLEWDYDGMFDDAGRLAKGQTPTIPMNITVETDSLDRYEVNEAVNMEIEALFPRIIVYDFVYDVLLVRASPA